MIYIAAILAIALFTTALSLFGIVAVASRVVASGKDAVRVMQRSELSDEDKERAIQQASLTLFGGFFSLLARGVAALLVSLLPLLAFDLLGLAGFQETVDLLATWQAIVVATIAMSLFFVLKTKL